MVRIPLKVNGDTITLYMDGGLYNHLEDNVKPSVKKKDFDYVLTVDGGEGCQPLGSKVLMANGQFKDIQNVKIGDLVLSPQRDGSHKFSKVINTTKWFSNENYDVFSLNRTKNKLYTCSYNHLIPLNYKQEPRINGQRLMQDSYWTLKHYSARHYSKLSRKATKKNTTSLLSFPIDKFLSRKDCEIEPYTLGAYLGDGSFCGSRLTVTSNDIGIVQEIKKYYKVISVSNKIKTTAKSYNFSKNGLLGKLLFKYGLFEKRSGDKFIPHQSLLSSIEYRKKLLAGLIDTDGYLSKTHGYSITTKSERMAKDILFLIHTLGGRGEIKQVYKTIKTINFKGKYYNISFYLGNIHIPLKLNRKIRSDKFFYLSANRIAIDCVKSEPCMVYGFTLDSPSQWYVTDNFMITHNSGKSVFAFQIAKVLDPNFTLDNVCFTPSEFIKAVTNAKPFSCIVFDEAFTGLSSRAALSEVNRLLVSLMMEMRAKNLFIILVMPTFFMLDKYAVLHRSNGLFHVHLNRGKRGFWRYYNKPRMKKLYFNGKKYYEYTEKPRAFGKFLDQYMINEKNYRIKKEKALKGKQRRTKAEAYKEQRDTLLYILIKKMKLGQRGTARVCSEHGFTINHSTLSDVFAQKQKELLETED